MRMENTHTLKQAHDNQTPHIADDLKRALRANDFFLYVVETDDLIAAWCHQHRNKFTRSFDPSRVPTENRYSAPPSVSSRTIPCHVSFDTKAAHAPAASRFGPQVSCIDCRTPGAKPHTLDIPPIDKLKAADFAKRNMAPYIAPFVDGVTLARLVNDLGIRGKVVTKDINGRQYVIFGGYAGLRNIFRGTRYSADHHKVVQMGIGKLGMKHLVKAGARLTIYITVPLSVLECILKDQVTMSALVGTVTADLVKVGIAGIAGFSVGLLAVTASAPAALTVFLAIGVGLVTSMAVEYIDAHYGTSRRLIKLIEDALQKPDISSVEKDDDNAFEVDLETRRGSFRCHLLQ